MSSSRKEANKILGMISPVAAEDFLLRLGNLIDDPDSEATLLAKYPAMFPVNINHNQVFAFRRELRRAWDTQDARKREWYLHSLRRGHSLLTRSLQMKDTILSPGYQVTQNDFDYLTDPLPEITPFEAALYYFQTRVGDLAKHCAHLDCPAPYFIAQKRAQKFCSEKCAGPATRESKRKWWSENRGKMAK